MTITVHSAAPTEYHVGELQLGKYIGEGGTARVQRCTTPLGNQMLFKRYTAAVKEIDFGVLRSLIEYFQSLDWSIRERLDAVCSLPRALVTENDAPIGIVIPEAPPRYYTVTRTGPKPREFTYVARKRATAHKFGNDHYPSPHKIARLGQLLLLIDFLHDNGIVIGDLQPKNILTTGTAANSGGRVATDAYLIDCDSFIVSGRSALPQMDPFAWRTPYPSREFSPSTDLSKFAMIATRVLVEDLSTVDIPTSHFRNMLPEAELMLLERLRNDPCHGVTSTDLKNMANAWRSVVSPSGRLHRRTTDQIWGPWSPEHDEIKQIDSRAPIQVPVGPPAYVPRSLHSDSPVLIPDAKQPAPTAMPTGLKVIVWSIVATIALLIMVLFLIFLTAR